MAHSFPHQRVSLKAGIPRKRTCYFHTVSSWNVVCLCSSTLSGALQNLTMHVISPSFSGTQVCLSFPEACKNLEKVLYPQIWPWLHRRKSQRICMTRHTKCSSRLTCPFTYKASIPKADTEALPVTDGTLTSIFTYWEIKGTGSVPNINWILSSSSASLKHPMKWDHMKFALLVICSKAAAAGRGIEFFPMFELNGCHIFGATIETSQ